jgi:hypothetical protein
MSYRVLFDFDWCLCVALSERDRGIVWLNLSYHRTTLFPFPTEDIPGALAEVKLSSVEEEETFPRLCHLLKLEDEFRILRIS